MSRLGGRRTPSMPHRARDQQGFTVVELMVASALMGIIAGAISFLIGASIQSKTISAVRSSDTETARRTLEWMSDRLRQAGFNVKPSAQIQPRCKDRVVAQDATLYPTANSVYFSGELLKTDTVAGDQVATFGYYLAADPSTKNQVVMEYNQPCSAGATSISAYSNRLSNPKINVTNLTFQYFDASGNVVTNLTSAAAIRTIQLISISLTVQGVEGTSKTQTQTVSRSVTFWDPEPNANAWVDLNENF